MFNCLFAALLLDILLVALIKAYFRRRRPIGNQNDAFAEIGPDEFSFPSGRLYQQYNLVTEVN